VEDFRETRAYRTARSLQELKQRVRARGLRRG
jgi:hypothetical protein